MQTLLGQFNDLRVLSQNFKNLVQFPARKMEKKRKETGGILGEPGKPNSPEGD